MTIYFVSGNPNKVVEVREMMPKWLNLLSLKDLNFDEDIAETAHTLEGNALLKAQHIHNKFGVSCFADDTGLEVKCLNNRPGVLSARYAGIPSDSNRNIDKLLQEMQNCKDRSAKFRTVIALFLEGESQIFEGEVNGTIAYERQGSGGFGYDSVFIPNGFNISFAEMHLEEKNTISHRYKAIEKLKSYLNLNLR